MNNKTKSQNIMECGCFSCNIQNLETIIVEKIDGRFSALSMKMLEKLSEIEFKNISERECVINVKDGRSLAKPVQVINILDENIPCANGAVDTLTHINVGKDSQITLIYCDDSSPKSELKIKHSIEVTLDRGSKLSLYKMENVNNNISITSNMLFSLKDNAILNTFFITLNGGHLENNIRVDFRGEKSVADLNGLYLVDKTQQVDTSANVFHYTNDCVSRQNFKGILDDEAQANFLGHILVDYNATNNNARQSNNNILLTDKAKVSTRPILEIYNDDVQCSHGATTGQIDEEALYYLRSRGISMRNARLMLLKAFCKEVLEKSEIQSLREGLDKLIEARLEGAI